VAFGNLDSGFEDGLWKNFPPAPWIVFFLSRHVFYWFYADQWKFAPCDRAGQMRPLYAVPQEKSS
jgi:hypothetical protein